MSARLSGVRASSSPPREWHSRGASRSSSSPYVACVYALAALIGFDVSEPLAWIPLLAFAFFATGVYASPVRLPLGLVSVAAAFAVMYAALARLTNFDPSLLFGLALTLGPWGLGLALRRALERERELGAEAERARLAFHPRISRAAVAGDSRLQPAIPAKCMAGRVDWQTKLCSLWVAAGFCRP
ncbi:MAG: hypothetical protein ABR583_06065 [Gaiellaceae bacterium]